MEMTGISGNNSLYNFGHHPYAPYGPPLSLIESDRSRICTPNVPVDLFSVHPLSSEVYEFNIIIIFFQFLKKEINSFRAFQTSKNNLNEISTRKLENVRCDSDAIIEESVQTPKLDQMNHLSSTAPCSAADRVFTVDRFIAPSLRDNRTSSA